MGADEIAAAGIPASMEAELERSRQSAGRLLDTLARRVGASRAAHYVKTHSAREMAEEFQRAATRRPLYALAIAALAGFLLGCAIKRAR